MADVPELPPSLALDKLRQLDAYVRIPARLKSIYPVLAGVEGTDEFGSIERLNAIEHAYAGINLGRAVDLGGKSGFFALSLLDSGRLSHATVIDVNEAALAAGRAMAQEMGLAGIAEFRREQLSLSSIGQLERCDTIICLNLIHHAGAVFDNEEVARVGWGGYATEWMRVLRSKATRAIFGIGFKDQKPPNWDVPNESRLSEFVKVIDSSGWSIRYDANVHDIRIHGVEKSNGRRRRVGSRTAGGATGFALRNTILKIFPIRRLNVAKYHLFLLE